MLETLYFYNEFAVDIKRGAIAGEETLHADCRSALPKEGSQQDDIWNVSWIPPSS